MVRLQQVAKFGRDAAVKFGPIDVAGIARAHGLLQRTELSVSEIALSTGFSDQSHFAKHFRRLTGMAPSQARWKQR